MPTEQLLFGADASIKGGAGRRIARRCSLTAVPGTGQSPSYPDLQVRCADRTE